MGRRAEWLTDHITPACPMNFDLLNFIQLSLNVYILLYMFKT